MLMFIDSGLKLWPEQLVGFCCNTKRFLFLPLYSHSNKKFLLTDSESIVQSIKNQCHILRETQKMQKNCWNSARTSGLFQSQIEVLKRAIFQGLHNIMFTRKCKHSWLELLVMQTMHGYSLLSFKLKFMLFAPISIITSALVLWYSTGMTVAAKLRK